jgi:peptidoglycan/xylan/chitin deacetylase (PgdA/CDA1 family)
MSETLDYFKTLRQRGLSVACRELKSRFIREPVKASINRVVDLCAGRGVVFTFFIVGSTAAANPDIVRRMLSRGHEIASHGYDHVRFDLLSYEKICADLERYRELFREKFDYRVKGFRAPYLKSSDALVRALSDLDFAWSSSLQSEDDIFTYPDHGIVELPIRLDDWAVLIRDNRNSWQELLQAMNDAARPGAVFLLHPWRVGQTRYVRALETFIESTPHELCSMSELAQGREGIALSGDIGEMSLWEIFGRLFK